MVEDLVPAYYAAFAGAGDLGQLTTYGPFLTLAKKTGGTLSIPDLSSGDDILIYLYCTLINVSCICSDQSQYATECAQYERLC